MHTICKEVDLKKHGITFVINGRDISFSLGEKSISLTSLPEKFSYHVENGDILISSKSELKKNFEKVFFRKILGTYISLFKNVVIGLTTGYHRTLNLIGSGYRSTFEEKSRRLSVLAGYSHPLVFTIPKEVKIELESNGTLMKFSGHDKQQLTQCVAKIYDSKKRNVYKGTGIYRGDQVIRTKAIKKK